MTIREVNAYEIKCDGFRDGKKCGLKMPIVFSLHQPELPTGWEHRSVFIDSGHYGYNRHEVLCPRCVAEAQRG